jgi:hypothetical protein
MFAMDALKVSLLYGRLWRERACGAVAMRSVTRCGYQHTTLDVISPSKQQQCGCSLDDLLDSVLFSLFRWVSLLCVSDQRCPWCLIRTAKATADTALLQQVKWQTNKDLFAGRSVQPPHMDKRSSFCPLFPLFAHLPTTLFPTW